MLKCFIFFFFLNAERCVRVTCSIIHDILFMLQTLMPMRMISKKTNKGKCKDNVFKKKCIRKAEKVSENDML